MRVVQRGSVVDVVSGGSVDDDDDDGREYVARLLVVVFCGWYCPWVALSDGKSSTRCRVDE